MQKGRGSDKEIFQKVFSQIFSLKIFYLKIEIKIPFLDSCDFLTVSRGSRNGGRGRGQSSSFMPILKVKAIFLATLSHFSP